MTAGAVLRRVVAVIMIVVGLVGTARVGWVGYGPPPDRVGAQLAFLDRAIAQGAAGRMQGQFPEGEFFTHVLTGLAEASVAQGDGDDEADRRVRLDRARAHLAVADDPATVAIFGTGLAPDHGVFAAGWSLSLAVAVARASADPADLPRVRDGAAAISTALADARSPFLASYPEQFWPCDTVVAVSALAEASRLLPDESSWRAQVLTWRARALTHVDPASGLFPHLVTSTGSMITGPRGSSNAIIQAFWPQVVDLTGTTEQDDQWERFTATFVTRQVGLVGVREYPTGTTGPADVDSGPLLLGVSASASAVGLAAARAAGDVELAATLSREADLLGLPLTLPGGTRYAFGVLPVGDAFLAWARTRTPPQATTATTATTATPVATPSPAAWWWAYAVPGVLLAGLGVLLWRPGRRVSRRSGPGVGRSGR